MNFKRIIITAAAALLCMGAGAQTYSQFQNPDNRYRPFVRWWWNGDRVEADELVRELHLLKEAGVGGVEINPISFPGGDTAGTKELIWLSDEWIDMLKIVFDEAEKIGMTCDLIIGSGWPFGAETLKRSETASVMLTYCQPVKGGRLFEMSKFHLYKAVDPGVSITNPRREPELVAMYLVPDPVNSLSEAIDITDKFEGDIIRMEIPEGKYQIYAMVRFDSFASVINGAPGAAGSILNHMDATAVRGYLDHMADTIEGRIGPLNKHLRAFFVDSMELEGNNWTTDFAEEFKARRGYDLMPWLPFTMFKVGRLGDVEKFEYGCEKGPEFLEQVNRVRFDFELTKAELLHERYTQTFLQWCREKGVKSRAQAYGRGFFSLESSLGYDIPEGESWTTNWLRHKIGEEMGDEDYRRGRGYTMINKYVSSAAHLTGKRLVSAEEMTNTYKVFSTSLEFLKVGSDMSAISGTTHSVWHGFNYSPRKAGFPGWVQYGSYYNDQNTWWPYFHKLNDYRARMASMLQNADMYTDIAILPANYDMWTTMGVQTDPFPVKLNVPYTSLIWEAIHKNGGGADYVTEIVLKDAKVKNGKICYGPKQYGTLFLPEVRSTYPETLSKLLEFVKTGGRVFCVGCYPEKSLGLKDYKERDAEIQAMVAELKKYPDNFILLENPSDGKYLEWYTDLMNRYNLPHTITISNPDRFLLQNRYVMDDKSDMFLFVNAHMSESRTTDIQFPQSVTKGKNAWIYDPSTGKRYAMPIAKDGKLHFEFGPSESYLFVFNRQRGGEKWNPSPVSGKDVITVESWDVSLHNTHTDSTFTAHFDGLKDLKDTEFKNFMGDATYTATVTLKGKELPGYINLGKVHEICELTVNGKNLGTDWFGTRVYDLAGHLKEGENKIEVKVTTLMANYLQTMPDNKVVYRYITRRNTPLLPSGLVGPVELYR
ncbi:MAG: glycoside hydrolase family 2 [Bacteroidales bacterium]|nr:glycoside hydrolase family 2 [Candidatus Cryptobacteroides equifaecalis]